MAVHLNLDTADLAKTYDEKNDAPYLSGCKLIDKLEIKTGDWVLDKENALKEIFRVLKPGGQDG